MSAELYVKNPEVTPTPESANRWVVELFEDDSTQYVRRAEIDGYELMSMAVAYKGNNQLGEAAMGFFTFTPISASPTAEVRIIVTPPPGAGYNVMCTAVSPLGFVEMPKFCYDGGVNAPLTLVFGNASVTNQTSYTVGVRIYNPGGKPTGTNEWGLSLQDANEQTFDALLRIPGLELKTLPMRVNGIGWTSAAPRLLNSVMIQLRVVHTIGAGILSEIIIRAPDRIMYNEDASTVKVLPLPLPLQEGKPTSVAGDLLTLHLDQQSSIEDRLYNIRFEVSNPSVYPHDNTWSVIVMRNVEIMFSHVLTGYVEGTVSPIDVSSTVAASSRASRGSVGPGALWPTVVLAAGMAAAASIRSAL
jgi:hypothetical protein